MSNRFNNPYPQFFNSTPTVYAGGLLYFYATGTSTPLDTYPIEALTGSPNSNPITLNSAGRPPVDIFLQDQDYKVVLKDSSLNTIWTADPVRTRDSTYIAKTKTGSGTPNGSVAGTAGSSSILPDFYWDYTNSILYVCTTTGTTTTAVWTAVNASSATPAVPTPQGRLTVTSGTPVISSDTSGQTAIYYTNYTGNLVPIYNGASMVPTEFSQLTLTLASQHVASTIYDVFIFSNSGVVTIATGPAWSVSTAGSCARGTGASTTELTRVKGLWVNAVSMAARNGSTTYTIGANLGTYVGSIFIDGSAGQVSCHTDFGQARKWGVWNAYNRQPIVLKMGDATGSWSTAPTTWRQSRADANNSLHIFSGLAEESYDLQFTQLIQQSVSSTDDTADIGIGYNSTTVLSGRRSRAFFSLAATAGTTSHTAKAEHQAVPALGINKINAIEQAPTGTVNNAFFGTADWMMLTAKWRG